MKESKKDFTRIYTKGLSQKMGQEDEESRATGNRSLTGVSRGSREEQELETHTRRSHFSVFLRYLCGLLLNLLRIYSSSFDSMVFGSNPKIRQAE